MTYEAAPPQPTVRERSVTALIVAQFCSAAATMGMATALGKQVYDLTGHELDLGLLGLAEFAPVFLLVLVTGTVADRLDRRRVGGVAALAEAGVALLLAWYASTKPTAAGPIFLLVLVFGVGRAFSAPAVRALPADVVPPERLPWIVPRMSVAWQTALIIGPVLAGFLYSVDPSLAYTAFAGLLVVAAFALSTVRYGEHVDHGAAAAILATDPTLAVAAESVAGKEAGVPAPVEAGWRDALEGLRFIRGHRLLFGAISLDLFAVLFGGAVALLPAIAKDRLHVGAVGLGWLRAAGGMGAAAATLLLVARPVRRRVGRTLIVVVALFGLFTIVLGATTSFAIAFLAMAALSAADAVSVFIRATLVPLVTPRAKRGRVLAVESVFIGGSNELGAFESGVAGQVLGTSGAVVLGGIATLAIAAGWWFGFPALRDVDRFPATGPDSGES